MPLRQQWALLAIEPVDPIDTPERRAVADRENEFYRRRESDMRVFDTLQKRLFATQSSIYLGMY